MWNDPRLFQDLLPIQSISASVSASGTRMPPQTQQHAPPWRPVKVFPPDRSAAVHFWSRVASSNVLFRQVYCRCGPDRPSWHIQAAHGRVRTHLFVSGYRRLTHICTIQTRHSHRLPRIYRFRQPCPADVSPKVSSTKSSSSSYMQPTGERLSHQRHWLDGRAPCGRYVARTPLRKGTDESMLAPRFPEVQARVRTVLEGIILVGYALWEFLSVSPRLHDHGETVLTIRHR